MSSPAYFSTNYTDYAKRAFNELKSLTYNTDILNRINRALERIDKAIEYENNGQPYSASQEIKKVFPEV